MTSPPSKNAGRRTPGRSPAATRLAVVISHPTQYYSPWFRVLAGTPGLDLKVFYLWDFGVAGRRDAGFGVDVTWDVPLLDGYEHVFVENVSRDPGTHRFGGLDNPGLGAELRRFAADAALVFGYSYMTHQRLIWRDRPRGVPLVFRGDSHVLADVPSLKNRIKRAVVRRVFGRFDAFAAVGRANAEYFRRNGVPDGRVFFAPHCVDNERFARVGDPSAGRALRRELGIPAGDAVLLFAGKFEPKKRPDELLAAFRGLETADAHLVFAGAGPLEGPLKEAAAGHPRVRFVPFRNQTAMPKLYAAADVLVLPSVGRYETWGLAVNEAMCCGCAVVVSDHVGCGPDLVRPGENGRVFRAGDVEALRAALAEAVADRTRLAAWREASRRLVSGYTFESARDGLLAAVDHAIRAAKRGLA